MDRFLGLLYDHSGVFRRSGKLRYATDLGDAHFPTVERHYERYQARYERTAHLRWSRSIRARWCGLDLDAVGKSMLVMCYTGRSQEQPRP
jgi:hypothetical protein